MDSGYKLDTAATLFPPVTRKTNTSIYRIAAVLQTQVDAAVLQQAADAVLKRFPMFTVKLVSTAFDQRFEQVDAPFLVAREEEYPCGMLGEEENNGYLFRILYHEKKISLEMFHALSDGTGAVEFMKTLLLAYFRLQGRRIDPQGMVLLPEDAPTDEEAEDALLRYHERAHKKKIKKAPAAFKIKGTLFEPYGHNIVQGVVAVDALKAAAKRYGTTITVYLTALAAYSIYHEEVREGIDEEPIVLSVPVNLRGFFPSKTMRNFFCIANITIPTGGHLTFDAILAMVRTQLSEKTETDNLKSAVAESCGVMENPVVQGVPRFMRDAGTRFVFAFFSEDVKTMTVSNVGQVMLPDDMKPLVDRMEAVIYPTERSPVNCCMCSVNGKMTISFIRSIEEADTIRYFFRYLARNVSPEIEIYTNNWGICDEKL